ncbi:MAG TPA: AMP-binding protein [Kiritimatiellia bacterium]|nr:AMP-binding protein [Kiritimatiellia bacterium]HOE36491.1 AMP-binding protein [Kiritimatiellia bacterium]HOR73607.1 AMP-binding protein [Kiritimatiellia bacterium]HQF20220.1 AMP-binding protein [Kiritimatiellia bacterium]HQG74779.1 AMP-binding protein [Kiritimatiellia bacterium]
MLKQFVPRSEFASYEDFRAGLAIHTPESFNFAYDVVDHYARTEPTRRAMVWCNDAGDERNVTFADLKDGSDRAAQVFQRHGIRKGDAVLLILKGRLEFWHALLGLHKLGAIGVPATHMLTEHDLEYRFERAGIRLVLTVPDAALEAAIDHAAAQQALRPLKMRLQGGREGWFDFAAGMKAADGRWERPTGEAATRNDDTMLIYFSSGTTGQPKMVAHDFTYPLGHIVTAKFWQNVRDGGLHYTVADTGWAKSAWGKLYGQWICGSAVFVHDYDKFSPTKTLEMCAKFGVTTFCAPPTVYRFLIKEDLSKYDFSKLEYAVVAGEPLNPEVYEQFLKATGLRLMEAYGQTEMTVGVGNFVGMEPKPGSMGKPSPLYEMFLARPDGSRCDPGEQGEIVVPQERLRARGMFQGYHRDPEGNARCLRGGVYHTGDVAWQDEDGYFWYVGRDDDLIKSSGYRIGPFEVESALMEHPAVMECAVTGVPDEERGQLVKATIVLAKGYEPSDELQHELQAHVKKVTAPYKYPRVVEFVRELPKTISGKIRRVEIRAQDGA